VIGPARPAASVVIPTHNRRDSVLRLLAALRDGTFPHDQFHVVVVADGCTDDTVEVLRATPFPFAVEVLKQSPAHGAATARNLGATYATGEIIVFIDDDIEPFPVLLEAHVRAHAHGTGQVVIGPPLPTRAAACDFDTLAAWGWWEEQFAIMSRPGHRFMYEHVFSGNFSMPASLFATVGGFDAALDCREDYELGLRLMRHGADVVFAPEAAGYHHELRDRHRLIRRKRAEGKADIFLAQRHPDLWPSLRLAWPLAPLRSPLGVLRRLAFAAPALGDLAARAMARFLDALEYLRMRGAWRNLQAGVMYYWYWRGVADTLGTVRSLAELAAWCADAGAAEADAAAQSEIEVDLSGGIAAAERRLDELRPAGARIRFGIHEIGRIPPIPGAEPLRGVHLRARLATDLSGSLGRALQTAEALGGLGGQSLVKDFGMRDAGGRDRQSRVTESSAAANHNPIGFGQAGHIAGNAAIGVSVIIPAYNASETLAEALDSLVAQTFAQWEAIVVDDGSTDGTAAVAGRYAAQDERIEVVRQENQGEGRARNTGLGRARQEWLLFLDSDDQLVPTALERLTGALRSDNSLDAVHGAWARVTADGLILDPELCVHAGDLFHLFAEYCAFPINACVVRKSCVVEAQGFDASLRTCEDWDLWQRVARAGARFGVVNDVVAHYRMRQDSLSTEWAQLFADGLRVIASGHAHDPRVPKPVVASRNGAPTEGLADARFKYACWVAGLVIGRGGDARPLLDALKDDRAPGLDPQAVAYCLFRTTPLILARPPWAWDELWQGVSAAVDDFLNALEHRSGGWRLARRARRALERLTSDVSRASRPFNLRVTHAVRVEITEPIPVIAVPHGAEHLHCVVESEGEFIGKVYLPICEDVVSANVLSDAIVAEHAWPILGRFFWQTIYCDYELREEADGWSGWLGETCVARRLPDDQIARRAELHDRVGWSLFLRELWGPAVTSENVMANSDSSVAPAANRTEWTELEVSEDLGDIRAETPLIHVEVLVGGVAVGAVGAAGERGVVTAAPLRDTITNDMGMELCRVAVREGVLGRSLRGGGTLRERLRTASRSSRGKLTHISATSEASYGGPPPIEQSILSQSHSSHHSAASSSTSTHAQQLIAPDWNSALARATTNGGRVTVLARHEAGVAGTSASRRAALPIDAAAHVLDAAAAADEPVVHVGSPTEQPQRLVYAPDLLWLRNQATPPPQASTLESRASPNRASLYGRHHFEGLFANGADPWRYETAYEQLKYEQTLSLLPSRRPARALELACAEGHFTRQLAARADTLVAVDISQVALDRAAARCADCKNVRFERLDLTSDQLPGTFDLVVCSEVLYYVGDAAALANACQKLADALRPGGHLLLAHANLLVDDPHETGFDWAVPFGARIIGETLAEVPFLRCVRELRSELYRIQLFRREPLKPEIFQPPVANVVETVPFAPPVPHVAKSIVWGGGTAPEVGSPAPHSTTWLPILMYHRVARDGTEAGRRYRVTPEALEAQLSYLRDAGFYSITLDRWRSAVQTRTPLEGRPVVLSFDDGFRDFSTDAWPLLSRYGFSATVFLVADLIGRTNVWDASLGEVIPLLNWEEIGRLKEAGVEFGSHSTTHYPMTGLSHADVAAESARSRAVLRRGLGLPVTAFAYPHGDTDAEVQHLVGACGFTFGLTTRAGVSGFQHSLLALPRLEVSGFDSLASFIAKMTGPRFMGAR